MLAFETDARRYERELQRGLSLSGETRGYFSEGRVNRLAEVVGRAGGRPELILDYGCGSGDALPLLEKSFPGARVTGADSSRSLVLEARSQHADRRVLTMEECAAAAPFDLVHCNGVFHHVPPHQRDRSLAEIHAWLRPGGWLALFENNPLNPGTRLVMRRIPFDRDAVTLFHWEAAARLRRAGFEVVRLDFLFFFPRMLKWLRFLDPALYPVPLGAQYLVLGRRPG